MIPEVHEVLGMFSGNLLVNLVPRIDLEYLRKDAELMAYLLMVCAEEYNRGADIRVRENQDMRRLFRSAAQQVEDPDLEKRLHAAAECEDSSLTITDLNASNSALNTVLIELHEHVEAAADTGVPWAQDLDNRIWDHLHAAIQRRAFILNSA